MFCYKAQREDGEVLIMLGLALGMATDNRYLCLLARR